MFWWGLLVGWFIGVITGGLMIAVLTIGGFREL